MPQRFTSLPLRLRLVHHTSAEAGEVLSRLEGFDFRGVYRTVRVRPGRSMHRWINPPLGQ